jgi:sugar phosphate isomerase/epimerase
MLQLAGFADEISPDLDQQVAACRRLGVSHFELRGVDGKNVLDFDDSLRKRIRSTLSDNGLAVACIGSPIGKVKIDQPWDAQFDRFKIAVDSAHFFSAPMIRVFSYYPPEGGDITRHRDEVIRRFRQKVDFIKGSNITLVHENERDIFGQTVARCLDLMKTINSPQLRSAFDFANFVQCGEDPAVNWPQLKPYVTHFHIKDAKADGGVVPAGQGVGKIAEILADAYASGYRGFLSLEPHLAAQGKLSGFSGPDLFASAVNALREVCAKINLPITPAGSLT